MLDLVILLVIATILAGAVLYIVREKKKGAKCIGCPFVKNCSKNNCKS